MGSSVEDPEIDDQQGQDQPREPQPDDRRVRAPQPPEAISSSRATRSSVGGWVEKSRIIGLW